MKKTTVDSCQFFVVGAGSLAFPQTYEVYNKFDVRGLLRASGQWPEDWRKVQRVRGPVQHRLRSHQHDLFWSPGGISTGLGQRLPVSGLHLGGSPVKANVWFRPNKHVELVAGNNFYMALHGSFMNVFNEFTPNGWYGEKNTLVPLYEGR